MFKVIDTHTHFDAEEFDEDRAEAFARAREAGVGKVLSRRPSGLRKTS